MMMMMIRIAVMIIIDLILARFFLYSIHFFWVFIQQTTTILINRFGLIFSSFVYAAYWEENDNRFNVIQIQIMCLCVCVCVGVWWWRLMICLFVFIIINSIMMMMMIDVNGRIYKINLERKKLTIFFGQMIILFIQFIIPLISIQKIAFIVLHITHQDVDKAFSFSSFLPILYFGLEN